MSPSNQASPTPSVTAPVSPTPAASSTPAASTTPAATTTPSASTTPSATPSVSAEYVRKLHLCGGKPAAVVYADPAYEVSTWKINQNKYILVGNSNFAGADCAKIGDLVEKSKAPAAPPELINWTPSEPDIYDKPNCQEAQDAGCAVAGPSPTPSMTPSPSPSTAPVEVIAINTGCDAIAGPFIYIPTSLLKYEDINGNAFVRKGAGVKPILNKNQFDSSKKTAWPSHKPGYLSINANNTCYSIGTGKFSKFGGNAVHGDLPANASITDDQTIIDAIKASQLKAAIAKVYFHEYCTNHGCTPQVGGVVPQPEISIERAGTGNANTGKYGYDFISDNLTADTATKVTKDAAKDETQIEAEFDIKIKHKDVPDHSDTGITYKFKVNQNISDSGDDSKLLQEVEAFGLISESNQRHSPTTTSIEVKFRKENGKITFIPFANESLKLVPDPSNDANPDSATFTISLRITKWGHVLKKYIGNRTEQPTSGKALTLDCSVTAVDSVVLGSADKETINLYMPLSSFFIGIKDDTIAAGDIRSKLNDFINTKNRKLCINGKDAEADCDTAYENTSYLLRAINLGGVGGTFTTSLTTTTFTPDSPTSGTYVGNAPDWWGEPQAMPNGSNFPFASFLDPDLVVNLKVYKQNISNPPKNGEILLAGEHVRVITFNNVNEDAASQNEFTLKLVVPATRVEVD